MPLQDDVTDTVREPVVSFDDPRSRSVGEFCGIENFGLSFYWGLKRRGLGPDELRPPGTKLIRITAASHSAWRERMRELAQSEAAVLAEERRRKQAAEAGKRSAQARIEAA